MDTSMAAELVIWNNGPIKAVSLTGAYRVYMLNPTNLHVIASIGISEPLVDYSFSLPELKPSGEYVRQILSGGSPALYVVNLGYYRETDMERYSTEDYFLFENGAFYDRESFRGRRNYDALMTSLLWKMRFEAQGGSNLYRVTDPPLPGTSHVNVNVLNVPEANSLEWGPIISNRMSEVAADPGNPAVYVRRGNCLLMMNRWEEAATNLERAIDLGSTNSDCYNNLAVIRSTSTNAVLRNGGQAVKLAKKACELTGWKSWVCVAALAGAFAETGDFASAVKYERQVMTMPGLLPLEREAEERALARMLDHLPVRQGL
jgi:tetratricopeptide (TPR) repeat protein